MRYYFNRVLDEYLHINCRRNIRILIVLALCFILGLILGLTVGGGFYTDSIFDDSVNFVIVIFTGEISFFAIIIRCFFISLQTFAIIFLFSLTVYLVPLEFIFVSYKGYVLGAAVVVFTQILGVQGFLNILILVLPQQLILLISVSLYISYSFYYTVNFGKYGCRHGMGIQFKSCLVFFTASLSNIIVQAVLIYVIIKPFNILI